jgi:hypothetical protein
VRGDFAAKNRLSLSDGRSTDRRTNLDGVTSQIETTRR